MVLWLTELWGAGRMLLCPTCSPRVQSKALHKRSVIATQRNEATRQQVAARPPTCPAPPPTLHPSSHSPQVGLPLVLKGREEEGIEQWESDWGMRG